jgi:GNAT superfamily N-acetyltransferase
MTEATLRNLAPGVFDGHINPSIAEEFLRDRHHHLAVAIDEGRIVGFASGVHYVHPDKPPQMFINEVGVAPTCQSRGIGRAVLLALIDRARELNCSEAWVLASRENIPAMRMYGSLGGSEDGNPVMFTFPLARRETALDGCSRAICTRACGCVDADGSRASVSPPRRTYSGLRPCARRTHAQHAAALVAEKPDS